MGTTGSVLPDSARAAWDQLWWTLGLLFVKGYHIIEFALLSYLVRSALETGRRAERVKTSLQAMILGVAYAALDEWHQTFVPRRGGTFSDVAIDLAGVIFGVCIAHGRSERSK